MVLNLIFVVAFFNIAATAFKKIGSVNGIQKRHELRILSIQSKNISKKNFESKADTNVGSSIGGFLNRSRFSKAKRSKVPVVGPVSLKTNKGTRKGPQIEDLFTKIFGHPPEFDVITDLDNSLWDHQTEAFDSTLTDKDALDLDNSLWDQQTEAFDSTPTDKDALEISKLDFIINELKDLKTTVNRLDKDIIFLSGNISEIRSDIGHLNEAYIRPIIVKKCGESFGESFTIESIPDLAEIIITGDNFDIKKLNQKYVETNNYYVRIAACDNLKKPLVEAYPIVLKYMILSVLACTEKKLLLSMQNEISNAVTSLLTGKYNKSVGLMIGITRRLKQERFQNVFTRMKYGVNQYDEINGMLTSVGPGGLLAVVCSEAAVFRRKRSNPPSSSEDPSWSVADILIDYLDAIFLKHSNIFPIMKEVIEMDAKGSISFSNGDATITGGETKKSISSLQKAKTQLARTLNLIEFGIHHIFPGPLTVCKKIGKIFVLRKEYSSPSFEVVDGILFSIVPC